MAIPAKELQTDILPVSRRMEFPAPRRANYTASVVRSTQEFAELRAPWNEFLAVCGETHIALRHEWLQLWLNTFPPERMLTILIRDEEGQLVGVAPLVINRNPQGLFSRLMRRVQFIGSSPEVYDWMKCLIHPNVEAEPILKLIANQIIRHRQHWDVVDLRYLESKAQLIALHNFLRPAMKDIQADQPMSIPFIELPENWADYPATLRKKKYQGDLKRIHNHIRHDFDGQNAELIVHTPGQESDKKLQQFLAFHKEYWRNRGSKTEYGRHPKLLDFYYQVHRQFSRAPEAPENNHPPIFEFSTLMIGNEPVSYHFDIQAQPGCMGYLSCYEQNARKYRPGILHIEALIERTHQLGGRRFEFGRGDEHYKNQWHIQKKPLWNLLAFRSPFFSLLWRLDARIKMVFRNGTNTHGATNDQLSPTPTQPPG